MLTKFVSIGSYSPEVCTFGTLITSTKVFSLKICNRLCENRTCRGINKNAVYPKGAKRKFMDLLIMNSPVSLGIVLYIR